MYMKDLRMFTVNLLLFLFGWMGTICAQDKPLIRFGLIADIQYCDCEPRINRYYKNSLTKLEEAVRELNEQNVDFTVNLGDLVDKDTYDNLDAVLVRQGKLENKVYNTTGNHDYGGVEDNEALFRRLDMPAEYYSFRYKNWRFIMLNTNEVSSYSNIEGTPMEDELKAMQEKIKATGGKNGAGYNGGISKKQLEWLEKELKEAQLQQEKVLVFSHHPLYAAVGLTALNDLEILNVLTTYSCVKGVISGHHHSGDFGIYRDIPFVTTEGMVETEKDNAYGIVDVFVNRIIITGKGRTKSYDLPFR